MSSGVSKRQQARNERALQDLIRTVPGNDQCADCQARNPGWASWSLGIFLCMRCASLHRKLGTHVSKVKSLSMDTWSSDQVEIMKRNGNTASNKKYNPKNVRPDMPLDADEIDSAMERFIRKKYQEKSLQGEQARSPSQGEAGIKKSLEESPPPPLPPKKGKLFGFGLRASSSAYPLSKHDKKKLPMAPATNDVFTYRSIVPRKEMTESELAEKLTTLREMGFPNNDRNAAVLIQQDGNIERSIEALVKLAEKTTPQSEYPPRVAPLKMPSTGGASIPEPQPQQPSNNPFDQITNGTTPNSQFGLSFSQQHSQMPNYSAPSQLGPGQSNNPFDTITGAPPSIQGLEQSFQGMQVSQPLFPHSTGGYPMQSPQTYDPRLQHSMTPPVPLMSQQYGYITSPSTINSNSNPFFQITQTPQTSYQNPFLVNAQSSPISQQSTNPFMSQFSAPAPTMEASNQTQPSGYSHNPFGIPPSEPQSSPPQQRFQSPPLPTPQSPPVFEQDQQSSFLKAITPSAPNPQTNVHRSFSQPLFQSPQQQNSQNPFYFAQSSTQSYQTQPQFQPQQAQPVQPQYNMQPQPQQPMAPQQTGRIDKSSILALYNFPNLAPQPPSLPSIPEPAESPAITVSPAPSNDPFASVGILQAKRSATMPVSTMSSTSRNPFLSGASSGNSSVSGGFVPRHVSQESVAISNLESGRHSPDAFASLSARSIR